MFGGIKVRLANLRIQYRLSSAAVVASRKTTSIFFNFTSTQQENG